MLMTFVYVYSPLTHLKQKLGNFPRRKEGLSLYIVILVTKAGRIFAMIESRTQDFAWIRIQDSIQNDLTSPSFFDCFCQATK